MLQWCFEWWFFVTSEFLATIVWWINCSCEIHLWYGTVTTAGGWGVLCQRWPNSRKRPAARSRSTFRLYQNLFAIFTMKPSPRLRCRSCLTNERLINCLHLCLNYETCFSSVIARYAVWCIDFVLYEKHFLIMVNCFSLKRSILRRGLKISFVMAVCRSVWFRQRGTTRPPVDGLS